MNDKQKEFERDLGSFPDAVQSLLRPIPEQSGRLLFEQSKTVCEQLGVSLEDLMVRLLPLAQHYARVPISGFRVGAVAKVVTNTEADQYDLFLGANMEFPGPALSQTVHAEQAVTMNAWMQGGVKLEALAVTAMPCGHCRQFLNEFEGGEGIRIIVPSGDKGSFAERKLSELLPDNFGPKDLGIEAGLMAESISKSKFSLKPDSEDPLVQAALTAAEKSYSPYTKNIAGAAIETADGKTYSGRYAENAAYNPSLSPLTSAVICMYMDEPFREITITRAVLVEKAAVISQHGFAELLLESIAPSVKLEYIDIPH